MPETARTLRDILLVYNTDYDDELKAETGADVSAVEEAAHAVAEGIQSAGFGAELWGVHGRDIGKLVERLTRGGFDLVFNLCESMNGDVRNEVVLPGVLEMLKIPYTGPGALAILLCLYKERTKEVLIARGVSTPEYRILTGENDLDGLESMTFPVFLKLAHEDASVGIDESNVATSAAHAVNRTRELWAKYHQPVLAERFITGREVNVTVMDDGGQLSTLPLHEISFADMPEGRPRIVSYAAKWDESHVDYDGTKPVPMTDISPKLANAIREVSVETFRALGLADFGRVDLRIDANGTPWVIDVNPNCDLSPDAGVARAARFGGLEYPDLLARICRNAWRRNGHATS